ncbi:multi-sensor signal transduction histidine kinase [Calothrix sp. NIES-4071]|nr:multi-sensor signal transduction histidine kinase [Calothrix sp. NIES-4071]BAZ58440.1 multi-sensor signal transduction histidine kinase [Calothrix sp. NIES-4105]
MNNLILVVDDDALTRIQLRELLQHSGYQIIEASSGEEALLLYQKRQPDMVLLDALMGTLDGFTCCAQLRATKTEIPILMVTGLADQISVERAFSSGATDYITKPIHWQVLRQRVRRLLEAKHTMEKLKEQTEYALRREAQLVMALRSAQMGIWDWNIITNTVTWSDDKESLFGLEKGTFAGTYDAFMRCVHPSDRNLVTHAIKRAVEEEAEYDLEFRVLLPDNTTRWMASKGVVFRDEKGAAVGMSGVDMDITKRKQSEEALEIYANRQAMIAQLSQLALAGSSLNDLLQQAVVVIAQSLGLEYCKILELRAHENNFLLRSAVGFGSSLVGKVFSAGFSSQFQFTLISPEPVIVNDFANEARFTKPQLLAEHNVESGVSVVIHGKERPFGVLGAYSKLKRNYNRDEVFFLQAIANVLATAIERKLAETRLQQSEERFQILAQATNDAVWDWDLITDRVWWNESVQTLFGYSTNDASSNSTWWRDRIHPDDKWRIVTNMQTVIDSGEQVWSNEYRFERADGSYAYILDRGYVVRQEGKAVRMIGAMMDISERKRVQEELQRQNLRSQLFADFTLKVRQSLQIDEILSTSVTEVQKLLNADRVLVLRLRSNGAVTAVQEAVVPGFPVMLGREIYDPCFSENYIQKYRIGNISSRADIEDGSIQDCHVQFLQQFAVKANLVVPILLQNQLWGLLIAHQCGCPRIWTTWETELLRQLADQIGVALAQAKLLEKETLQRQELTRSNEELQQFAFIASHDLQEPLRKIKAFGDRLKSTCNDSLSLQGRDYLERMQNAAGRMQALIEDLLTLSRVTTRAQPFVPVNLSQIVSEVLCDLEVTIAQVSGRIELSDLPTINADPLQMRQLLQNLIGNALKFHRPHQVPVVSIYSEIITQENDIQMYKIIVKDNGIGFDEKYCDRIFQVFQRLHGRSEYDGTGIGLAICRKIVERHQGTITAKSQPGQGAFFIVTLPLSK